MPNGSRIATSRRALRYRLALLLHAVDRPLTVAEMVDHLEQLGWPAPAPAAKSVADSLRWEVGHARVRRVGRGRYAAGTLDRRTRWWMQRQLDQWDAVERVSATTATPASGPAVPPDDDDALPAWFTALRHEGPSSVSANPAPTVLHPPEPSR
jgi:hypothetical protein